MIDRVALLKDAQRVTDLLVEDRACSRRSSSAMDWTASTSSTTSAFNSSSVTVSA